MKQMHKSGNSVSILRPQSEVPAILELLQFDTIAPIISDQVATDGRLTESQADFVHELVESSGVSEPTSAAESKQSVGA
ncbi:MAG: hypothetical protein CMJ78_00590 [Planctomycetaceae bacterium]|nr:hypothetical protein [Planctomycetaceae bacterium]